MEDLKGIVTLDPINPWKVEKGVLVRRDYKNDVKELSSSDGRWSIELPQNLGGRIGGFASIYKAYDNVLDITVAIKVEQPYESSRADFALEAHRLGMMNHPSIPHVYAFCAFDDSFGSERQTIVMDYINIDYKSKPYIPRVIALRQIAEAIDYSHSVGIYNGDIKPASIVVGAVGENDPRAYLVDWGYDYKDPTDKTIFTNRFAHPDLVSKRKSKPDHETDMYSWGITILECFKGEFHLDEAYYKDLDSQDKSVLNRLKDMFEPPYNYIMNNSAKKIIEDILEIEIEVKKLVSKDTHY